MLSKRFNRLLGVSIVSVAALTGCNAQLSTTAQEDQQGYALMPKQCTVVDLNTKGYLPQRSGPYNAATYNFKTGTVSFNTFTGIGRAYLGSPGNRSQTVAMKDLAEDGQTRAAEMFSKLPPAAGCKAPSFNK